MDSKWEQIDVASIKGLQYGFKRVSSITIKILYKLLCNSFETILQSISSLVAGFTLSSYSDIEFFLEVGSVEEIKTVKKDQIEKEGIVYERMHNNLFAFAFAVNRVYNELVTKAQTIAYIPSNEPFPFEEEDEQNSTVVSLWYIYVFYF
jgi:hypothetical protein